MDKKTFSKITKDVCKIYNNQYRTALQKNEEIKIEFVCGILKGIEILYKTVCAEEFGDEKDAKIPGNITKEKYDPIKSGVDLEKFVGDLSEHCGGRDCVNECDPASAKWLDDWTNFMADNISVFEEAANMDFEFPKEKND